jgi:hypothetical protein
MAEPAYSERVSRTRFEWHGIHVDVVELSEYPACSFDVVTLIGWPKLAWTPRPVNRCVNTICRLPSIFRPSGLVIRWIG